MVKQQHHHHHRHARHRRHEQARTVSKLEDGNKQLRSEAEDTRQIMIRNLRHAFHEARKVYSTIAQRSASHRIFLPRNLRRSCSGKLSNDIQTEHVTKPKVTYRSVEDNVPWDDHIDDLRCLWCQDDFFHFYDALELLNHLKTCHGMLHYSLEQGTEHSSKVTVNMRLLRESAAGAESPKKKKKEPVFHHYMFESTLVNKRKREDTPQPSPDINTTTEVENGEPDRKRLRRSLSRACRNTNQQSSDNISASFDDEVNNNNNSNINENDAAASRRRGKNVRRRVSSKRDNSNIKYDRKPTFKSIEEGASKGRLFHSIDQTPLNIEKFEMTDSDHEDEAEQGWRFKLRQDDIVDFVDTIPSEMLFMNLWNQFVGMECKIDSDKNVANACILFVQKYHRVMRRLKFEVSFLRHLSEMVRLGLLDSDDIYGCVLKMKELSENENIGEKADEEPTFLFENSLLRMYARKLRKSKRIERKRLTPNSHHQVNGGKAVEVAVMIERSNGLHKNVSTDGSASPPTVLDLPKNGNGFSKAVDGANVDE